MARGKGRSRVETENQATGRKHSRVENLERDNIGKGKCNRVVRVKDSGARPAGTSTDSQAAIGHKVICKISLLFAVRSIKRGQICDSNCDTRVFIRHGCNRSLALLMILCYGLIAMTDMPEDGSCLFHAVGHESCLHLGMDPPVDATARRQLAIKLRNKAVNELIKRKDFMAGFMHEDFDEYVEKMWHYEKWSCARELLMPSFVLE